MIETEMVEFKNGEEYPILGGKVILINPIDKEYVNGNSYVLCFGAHGSICIMVYATSLEAALDLSVDFLSDNFPGVLADEQVAEALSEAISEGHDPEESREIAEMDTTVAGNCGNYLNSWEWGISLETPSRSQLVEFIGRC